MNLINEIKSFRDFYSQTDRSERDIVFYAEDASSYGYFEGLIDFLTHNEDLKVCYVTSDASDPVFTCNRKNFRPFYINSLLAFFTVTLDSRLLLMTMPDLHHFHIKRSERGAHHVYLFHNMGSSFPVIRYGALFHYDTIFCSGPHHAEEVRRQEEIYDIPAKNLVKFGYYRLEKIYEAYKKYKSADRKTASRYRARILIGPSWGPNSILDLCGLELIRLLLRADYEVIVRPHPMTKRKNPRLLGALSKGFGSFGNYKLEENTGSVESVYDSDLLISDWSGFTFEYAFGTERPVLFIDVPQKIVNPRYGEVGITPMDVGIRNRIGSVLGLHELKQADVAITNLLNNKKKYVSDIVKARNESVYNFGSSSSAGAEFICNFLHGTTAKNEE